jgi:hypothetical protein
MAKLYFNGVLVMHDIRENVQQVICSGRIPVGINVKVEEE